MPKPLIIAFTGAKGSGKDTAAHALIEFLEFKDLKFAGPLKDMLRALYDAAGLIPSERERRVEGDLKEVPCDILAGKTPRHAMQTLGTEWRDMIDTNLWTTILVNRIGSMACRAQSVAVGFPRVVISDLRFPHEEAAIRKLGGWIVRVDRPSLQANEFSAHASETLMNQIVPDLGITNDGDIKHLEDRAIGMAMRLIMDRKRGIS